jgi:hypothetical protein
MTELEKIMEAFSPQKREAIKQQLGLYLQIHREEILSYRSREQAFWGKDIPLDSAVKMYILSQRTIDVQSEMRDQVTAMKTQIEPLTQAGTPERRSLAVDWVHNHAKTWRSLRVMGIIYVFNLHKDYFLSILQGSPQ